MSDVHTAPLATESVTDRAAVEEETEGTAVEASLGVGEWFGATQEPVAQQVCPPHSAYWCQVKAEFRRLLFVAEPWRLHRATGLSRGSPSQSCAGLPTDGQLRLVATVLIACKRLQQKFCLLAVMEQAVRGNGESSTPALARVHKQTLLYVCHLCSLT